MRAPAETLAWIRSYYRLMDNDQLEDCARFFTPDAEVKIAHYPPMVGWDAIQRSLRAGLAVVGRIDHEVLNVWEADDDTLVFEVVAHYRLKDDRKVDVPGVVIAEIREGRFHRQRIGADLSVVYGQL
jgi:hypothetical protein